MEENDKIHDNRTEKKIEAIVSWKKKKTDKKVLQGLKLKLN